MEGFHLDFDRMEMIESRVSSHRYIISATVALDGGAGGLNLSHRRLVCYGVNHRGKLFFHLHSATWIHTTMLNNTTADLTTRRTTFVVLCSIGILMGSVPCSAAEEPQADLLQVVVETTDALLEHGRDRWGPEQSQLLVSVLDRRTLEPYRKLPKGATGVRNSDRTTLYGSNVNVQQNLFRTFYLLSRITGDAKYAQAADTALLDFVRKTQAPATGLLAWGEHLCWDLQQDQAATMAQKLIHEPKKPLIF